MKQMEKVQTWNEIIMNTAFFWWFFFLQLWALGSKFQNFFLKILAVVLFVVGVIPVLIHGLEEIYQL